MGLFLVYPHQLVLSIQIISREKIVWLSCGLAKLHFHPAQVCSVSWSGPHQGQQAHVDRYKHLAHPESQDVCRFAYGIVIYRHGFGLRDSHCGDSGWWNELEQHHWFSFVTPPRDSPIMHSSVPDEFKPVIFAAGPAECPSGRHLFLGTQNTDLLWLKIWRHFSWFYVSQDRDFAS